MLGRFGEQFWDQHWTQIGSKHDANDLQSIPGVTVERGWAACPVRLKGTSKAPGREIGYLDACFNKEDQQPPPPARGAGGRYCCVLRRLSLR